MSRCSTEKASIGQSFHGIVFKACRWDKRCFSGKGPNWSNAKNNFSTDELGPDFTKGIDTRSLAVTKDTFRDPSKDAVGALSIVRKSLASCLGQLC